MIPAVVPAGFPLANIVFDTFVISDSVGKGIVVALVVASVVAWSIIVMKWSELKKIEKADQAFQRAFDQQRNPLELYIHGPSHNDSHLAKVYAKACVALRREFETRAHKEHRELDRIDLSKEKLSALQIDAIRRAGDCEAANQILLVEGQMSLLGSVYTIAPMLGLLGTVWGVMAAFHGMGQHGSANISAVAPGISSALLTTVIGLVVAMPAAFMANWLNDQIRFLSVQLENFPEIFSTKLQQTFLYE
ncbi:MAG: hypothetical protein GX803_09465 [Lentisphaerae bacterium]|jgi:biopolymer transport protein ExbB/TolQ|nr:hypothetical protein [Lentisphaerota bacterium]